MPPFIDFDESYAPGPGVSVLPKSPLLLVPILAP